MCQSDPPESRKRWKPADTDTVEDHSGASSLKRTVRGDGSLPLSESAYVGMQ